MGAQKGGGRKAYTQEDDEFIRSRFGDWSNRQIAQELGRTESGIRYRAKKLGLVAEPHEIPRVDGADDEGRDRLSRLVALRRRMEDEIDEDCIPTMQKPAYFREYRALLKEIEEIEGAGHDDGGGDGTSGTPIADAIASLVALQREILAKAREA